MGERSNGHWLSEDFRQRVTLKQWKEILLNEEDTLIFRGLLRKLKARNLGAGVYEIYKVPRKEG